MHYKVVSLLQLEQKMRQGKKNVTVKCGYK